jgi:hypothetical protein
MSINGSVTNKKRPSPRSSQRQRDGDEHLNDSNSPPSKLASEDMLFQSSGLSPSCEYFFQ